MMVTTRRSFLKSTAAATAAFALGGGALALGCSEAPADAADAVPSSESLEETDGMTWDYAADVVLVGGGAACMMAAAAAHEQGASTLLIEKASVIGGDSSFALGIQAFWPDRRIADGGSEDTAESFLEDWKATHENRSQKGQRGEALPEQFPFVERYFELWNDEGVGNSLTDKFGIELYPTWDENAGTPIIKWNTENGPSPCVVFPTGRHWRVSTPLPAAVNAVVSEYDDHTELVNSEVTDIIQDQDGRAIGVAFIDAGGEIRRARANRGVVLGTGAFTGNAAMLGKYIRPAWNGLRTSGVASNTGDGIRIAQLAGAQLVDMDLGCVFLARPEGADSVLMLETYMSQFSTEPGAIAENVPGILVNQSGQRVIAESRGYTDMMTKLADEPSYLGYYVCDSTLDYSALDGAVIRWADTIEELAAAIGVDSNALIATVDRYNGFVDAGVDEDFGKNMPGTVRLEQPPFFAIRLDPEPYMSMGGVKTDVDSRVLAVNEEPIPSLYAAGAVCGSYWEQAGLVYNGCYNQAIAYGWQAGKMAAAEAPLEGEAVVVPPVATAGTESSVPDCSGCHSDKQIGDDNPHGY